MHTGDRLGFGDKNVVTLCMLEDSDKSHHWSRTAYALINLSFLDAYPPPPFCVCGCGGVCVCGCVCVWVCVCVGVGVCVCVCGFGCVFVSPCPFMNEYVMFVLLM